VEVAKKICGSNDVVAITRGVTHDFTRATRDTLQTRDSRLAISWLATRDFARATRDIATKNCVCFSMRSSIISWRKYCFHFLLFSIKSYSQDLQYLLWTSAVWAILALMPCCRRWEKNLKFQKRGQLRHNGDDVKNDLVLLVIIRQDRIKQNLSIAIFSNHLTYSVVKLLGFPWGEFFKLHGDFIGIVSRKTMTQRHSQFFNEFITTSRDIVLIVTIVSWFRQWHSRFPRQNSRFLLLTPSFSTLSNFN